MYMSTKSKFLSFIEMQVFYLVLRQIVLISLPVLGLVSAGFVIGTATPATAQVNCPNAPGNKMLIVDEDTAGCTVSNNALPPPPSNGAQIRTFSGFTSVDLIRVVAGAQSPPTSTSCPGAIISVFPGAGTSVRLTPGTTCQLTATFNNPGGVFTITGQLAVSAGSTSSATGIVPAGGSFFIPPTIIKNIPSITSVAPSIGSTAGSTTVIITGTNFTGATVVTFGGNTAKNVTVNSATQITATTPPGTVGAVDVVVTTPGGTVTSNDGFTYIILDTNSPTVEISAPSKTREPFTPRPSLFLKVSPALRQEISQWVKGQHRSSPRQVALSTPPLSHQPVVATT